MAVLIGSNKIKTAVFISGNGSNMQKIIQAYKNGEIKSKVVTVVSNNPNTKGIKKAQSCGIITKVINHREFNNTIQFEKTLSEYLFKKSINLICLAGFMRVLGKNFITKWDRQIINIHPSLLPKYKGLNTFSRILNNGEKTTGCSVHYVNKRLDSGNIIVQKKFFIEKFDNEKILKQKTQKLEYRAFPEAIIQIFRGI